MLSEPALTELARQIATQEAAAFWPYWLVLLALSLVVAAISGWVAAYFKVRGENYATRADFARLLTQLELQTIATETIRTTIAQSAWLTQEWNRTRRTKLEEYLQEVKALPERSEAKHHLSLYGPARLQPPKQDLLARCAMLQALYFDELEESHDELVSAVLNYDRAALEIWRARMNRLQPGVLLEHVPPTDAEQIAYADRFMELLAAIERVKHAAKVLMGTLASERERAQEAPAR